MLQHVIWHVTYQGLTWRGPRHPKGTGDAVMDSTFYMSVYWGSGMHTLMPPHNSFQGATCECFVITKGGIRQYWFSTRALRTLIESDYRLHS